MVPGDILYQFYPWKAFAPSPMFHPHNPLLTDIVESVFPWMNLWKDSVFSGEIPLWNMRAYCGSPFAANLVSASFHPFRLLLFLMSSGDAATFFPFLRLFIAAMGMFLLLRSWRVSWHASLAGGFVFAFCGVNIVWLSNYPNINVTMLVPWIFLACDRIAKGKKLIWMIFFAVLSFVQFLGGHPETSFHVYAAVVPFFLWQLYRQKSKGVPVPLKAVGLRSLAFCAGGLLGLLLSSFQLLPFLEYLPLTSRYISIKGGNPFLSVDFFSVIKDITVTFFSPDFLGNPVHGNFWGCFNYNEQNVYITVAALFLALISTFNFRRGLAEKRFFIFTALVSYLIAVRTPIIFDMVDSLPFFKLACNHRLIFLVSFSLAVLAASGIDEIHNITGINIPCSIDVLCRKLVQGRNSVQSRNSVQGRQSVQGGKYLVAAFILLLAGAAFFHFISCSNLNADQMSYRIATLKRFFLYLIIVLCVCFAAIKSKTINRFFPFMVICLILVEIVVWADNYNTFVKRKDLFFSTPLTDFIKSRPGVFRVASLPDALVKGCGLVYGFDSPVGMDPMKTATFERILSRINHKYFAINTPGLTSFNSPWLDFLNVKYYVAGPFDDKKAFGRHDLVLEYKGIDGKVFKSCKALPRAFYVKHVITANSYKEALDLSIQHEKELDIVAVFEQGDSGGNPDAAINCDGYGTVSCRGVESVIKGVEPVIKDVEPVIKKITENCISIYVNPSVHKRFLVMSMQYYPGWHLEIDGRKAPLFRADSAFTGAVIPPGAEKIKLFFSPASFKYGVYLTSAGVVILISA